MRVSLFDGVSKRRLMALVVGGTAVLFFVTRLALANALADRAPNTVLQFSPLHPEALGEVAQKQYVSGNGERALSQSTAVDLQRSLRRDPLSKRIIRLLGLHLDLAGEPDRAAKLMNLGDKISRRDLPTQFWLMQKSAETGDEKASIRHLDAGMTASSRAWDQLFPVLAQGLQSDQFRDALEPFIREQRPWSVPFLRFAVENSNDPIVVEQFLRDLNPLPDAERLRPLQGRLVAHLVSAGEIDRAEAFAIEVLKVDAATLRDFSIVPETLDEAISPLSWTVGEPRNVSVTIADAEAHIRVITGRAASAMTRYFPLGSGEYSITYAARPSQLSETARAVWVFQCPTEDRLLPISRVPATATGRETAISLQVPSECRGLRVDVVVDGSIESREAFISVKPLMIDTR